jgi:type VI secretion system VasD/TssJ family lipoprotein
MRSYALLLAGLLILVTGCSNSLEVVVFGGPDMNDGGNAAVVKVYQLTGRSNFQSTPLSAFWRGDDEALGKELAAPPRKMTAYPSTTTTVEVDLTGSAQYVGIAANLRRPDREEWRSLHALDDMGDEVAVTVERRRVTVEVEDRTLPNVAAGLGR